MNSLSLSQTHFKNKISTCRHHLLLAGLAYASQSRKLKKTFVTNITMVDFPHHMCNTTPTRNRRMKRVREEIIKCGQ